MASFRAGEGPLTTRPGSWQRLAGAFFKHAPVPKSGSLSGRPSQPASCVTNVAASLEGRAAGQSAAAVGTGSRSRTVVACRPKNLKQLLGAFRSRLAPPDGLLPGHVCAITHCPPGRAEPSASQAGRLLPVQRRMTYLLACQSLPCLWKSHPAKQNSPLPIGSSRGPC